MKENQIDEIEKLITKYAKIRVEFEKAKKDYEDYLAGNDNYIGIIGEYWAKRFLEQRYPKKKITVSKKDDGKRDLSSEWTDFQVANELISVKAITEENNSKESGYIKYPKEEQDDKVYSAIIVKLNNELFPEQLLYVKNLDESLKKDKKFMRDYMKNWEKHKLCFRYYDSGFDTKFNEIYLYNKDLSAFQKLG